MSLSRKRRRELKQKIKRFKHLQDLCRAFNKFLLFCLKRRGAGLEFSFLSIAGYIRGRKSYLLETGNELLAEGWKGQEREEKREKD